ncbi:monosaccharide ABC transporter membrane protein (CUT2 family) [Roseiarcus fermentans]|uniref:Monosaccharide ABC transporter membrane protein (CUT2 family) n=1 Tax=Roseiarcus fermentans TaxID=1473586 RepID=A0A366EY67_9HYPH|nr:ABC transporter permease [Roseiarcus fermentans]RBP07294.1 monosaccharide ABC transporter membrane protein (CUT2 family) [Roseiarcus fermentans]
MSDRYFGTRTLKGDMTNVGAELQANPQSPAAKPHDRAQIPMRFVAIWIGLGALMLLSRIFVPPSVEFSTLMSVLPFAAFLTCVTMGQTLVLMGRGIDLSPPAIISLTSTTLLGVSGGHDDRMWLAIGVALLAAVAVGLVNGVLVALVKLNALIVTLSTGAIVSGVTLWYRQSLAAESKVPGALANFGGARFIGIPTSFWIVAALAVVIAVMMKKTVVGRRFEAVGANPRAAYATGVEIIRYQAGSFVVAALLYGVAAILLSAFIRNPTLEVGAPYLLSPIAAAVLGGTAIAGGIGNMFAVAGASLFLIQLDHSLKMLGLATSYQLVIQGVAIAFGMWLSEATGRVGRRY